MFIKQNKLNKINLKMWIILEKTILKKLKKYWNKKLNIKIARKYKL